MDNKINEIRRKISFLRSEMLALEDTRFMRSVHAARGYWRSLGAGAARSRIGHHLPLWRLGLDRQGRKYLISVRPHREVAY